MSWEPKYGERVIVTLPDGHEIEGLFEHALGLYSRVRFTDGSIIYVDRDHRRPVDPPEPKAFGAQVIDGRGQRFVRVLDVKRKFPWRSSDPVEGWMEWAELARPITIRVADPDWGES